MLMFIAENLATIVVGAVILAVVLLIVLKLRRDKKKGATGCGCSCDGCPSAGSCREE